MIRRTAKRSRLGFTLIELMIVIVIIGILIALLLPVIVGAVRRAREGQVTAEIQTIAMGLARFKEQYGEYPPSRVVLNERGIYSVSGGGTPTGVDFQTPLNSPNITWYVAPASALGSADISFGELASRSLRILRKMYPRAALAPVDRNNSGSIELFNNAGGDYWPDFNGNAGILFNGTQNAAPDLGFIYLEGNECLAFFLGGIPLPTVTAGGTIMYGASGFGKDPQFPFKNGNAIVDNSGNPAFISTANRTAPSYEFKADRLVDLDGDGIPGYLDPNASGGTGTYYAYFVSYGAAGYDPNDNNFGDENDIGTGTQFRVGFPMLTGNGVTNTIKSPSPNPYTSGLPTPVNNGAFNPSQTASWVNANSFQIIASGNDGFFGPGGQWSTNGDRLPLPPAPPYDDVSALRPREQDNLTNFTNGRLSP